MAVNASVLVKDKVILKAPAKVNWHLAVGPRREDGYHPISSIFQTCSLCDELEVSVGPGPFSVEVTGLEALCPKGKSTIDKAAELWNRATGFDLSVSVHVTKNIPSQAGLGGGSSDAASLLIYLNSLSDCPMTLPALMQLGAAVGCDVPFFVSQYRAAYVCGLGEIVTEIPARDLSGYILVPEGVKVSTKEAYAALDGRASIPELDSLEDLVSTYQRPVSEWSFRNDFDLVNSRPSVVVAEGDRLMLTGSGSCHVLLSSGQAPCSDCVPVTF